MSYLLDANVFIQAKNLHYGLDFCPAFWQWMIDNGINNRVLSIDKIADEIAAGADELTQWAKEKGSDLFRVTDAHVAAQLGRVSTWVTTQQYEPVAVSTFLQAGDFFLIAHALAGGHTVVTHEVAANSAKRIKIPNVCVGLAVPFMTLYQMLRIEQARFVLGSRA